MFTLVVTYSPRVRMSWLSLAAVLVLTLGCTAPDDPAPSAEHEADLTFDYFDVAEAGTIDQTVTITNSSGAAAVPTLSYVALDDEGRPLEHVDVSTAFGSDRGLVVAPAQYEVFDILRFEGSGTERVEDVEVAVEAVRSFEDSGTVYPEVEYLDAAGRSVPTPALAETVRVQNPGAQDYVVRLVGIQWDFPAAGQSQQARRVTPVGGPVSVRANDATDVLIPASMRGKFDSLKGYISTD